MKVQSMTGFGRAEGRVGAWPYALEIRAVNHRFLDLRIRCPRELAAAEGVVRARASARLRRGRVEVNLQAIGADEDGTGVDVDLERARAHLRAHQRLAEALDLPLGLDAARLAALPGVLRAASPEFDAVEATQVVGEMVDRALDGVCAMRSAEGAALGAAVAGHLDRIDALRLALAERAEGQAGAYRARLEGRMRELLASLEVQVDPARLLTEVAVFAERADVAEEIARLASHVAQARALLEAEGDDIGRRLDFLCQEMHREANTVGSKAQAGDLVERVIDLKGELERLREQVQNIE